MTKGDASQLGAPERYMRCMLTLPDVAQRMCILMYKLSFLGRWQEVPIDLVVRVRVYAVNTYDLLLFL